MARALVRELILREFQVTLSEVSVGRAVERDPQMVQAWLQEEFPALRAWAKREDALLFFGDEAGMRSDYHAGTTWAPVGSRQGFLTSGAISTPLWTSRKQRRKETQTLPENPGRFTHRAISSQKDMNYNRSITFRIRSR